jgi:hypothetical protein
MAQSASLAQIKAQQARQNLENYVFGTSVSTVPPVVPPMLPRGAATYPAYPYTSSPTQWPTGAPPVGGFPSQTPFSTPRLATASLGLESVFANESILIDHTLSRNQRIQDFL